MLYKQYHSKFWNFEEMSSENFEIKEQENCSYQN